MRRSPAPGSVGKSQRRRGAQAGRRPRGESLSLRFAYDQGDSKGGRGNAAVRRSPAPGSAGKSQRQRGAQAGRRPRGESLSLRRVGASSVSLAPAFSLHDKSRSALTPLLLLSAKGSARLACSLASALTTARHRCQPFAGAVRKAHASHGPSALHMIKGIRQVGKDKAPAELRPRGNARLRSRSAARQSQRIPDSNQVSGR